MREIIDSHAHLAWESYAEDQKAVLERAFQAGVVQIVHAGVDMTTVSEMIALAEQYPQIFLGFGLHPHEARFWSEETEAALRRALAHPRAVAVGECGLDYYYHHSDRQSQLMAFKAQVSLARELGKPLIVHSRDAWDDTFAVLEELEAPELGGVFHCFTGGPEVLPKIESLDFYVSFSGIVTFKNAQNIQEAARLVPEDRILVETDCPFLAPQPVRGKRNEPAYVWMVAEKVAELRAVSVAEIARSTTDNARRLFRLPVPAPSPST
ncbi:MAG TPA: TatD family hydrolase [Candidatus Obscuribacterales bacterium]